MYYLLILYVSDLLELIILIAYLYMTQRTIKRVTSKYSDQPVQPSSMQGFLFIPLVIARRL